MYMRSKIKSKIWSFHVRDFQELVKSSNSLSDVCRKIGLRITGKAHRDIKYRCLVEDIDISHIRLGRSSNLGRKFGSSPKILLKDILIEKSKYLFNKNIKKRLLEEKLLKNNCYICGLSDMWNNKKLSLQLDHINGIPDDNRIENLRLLCPNCHSQTPTFGRKVRKAISANG